MDILSHGLWAGAAAEAIRRRRPVTRSQLLAAVLLGLLPDIGQILPVVGWSLFQAEPMRVLYEFVTAVPGKEPSMSALTRTLSHHLHCILHSAVIASVATLLAWRLRPTLLVPLAGWWTHITLDIPSHSSDYYAVPFLYPFTYWGFDGVAWTTPWVLGLNYAAIAVAYAALFLSRRRPSR